MNYDAGSGCFETKYIIGIWQQPFHSSLTQMLQETIGVQSKVLLRLYLCHRGDIALKFIAKMVGLIAII